jgi:hypothetical protein
MFGSMEAIAPPESSNKRALEMELKCNVCGNTEFSSRNQLFKHIKICEGTSKKQAVSVVDADAILTHLRTAPEYQDVFIYAIGGRCRGRTLQSCERFSFKKFAWEPW